MSGGNVVYSHALLETFSSLTGGRLGIQVGADFAAQLLSQTIRPRVGVVALEHGEILAALFGARKHGVRGGAVYDYMHLVAARKAGAARLYAFNISDFQHLRRPDDPEIQRP
jgi:predicted nucleic acid-binding protein